MKIDIWDILLNKGEPTLQIVRTKFSGSDKKVSNSCQDLLKINIIKRHQEFSKDGQVIGKRKLTKLFFFEIMLNVLMSLISSKMDLIRPWANHWNENKSVLAWWTVDWLLHDNTNDLLLSLLFLLGMHMKFSV